MPSNANIFGQLKQGVAAGVMMGGFPYARNVWYTGDRMPQFANQRADSIEDVLAHALPGDVLFLGPQAYEEGNLVIPATLNNFTIIGMGGRGACYIEPSTSGDEGLTVLADDVTLINVGVADGGGAATQALKVGDDDTSPDRFRAYGCKFEGTEIAALFEGAGDVLIDGCEFAWANSGLVLGANNNGFCTQFFVQGSRFHNNATACIAHQAAAAVVNNLQLWNNIFDQLEDGTEPTDFILLSDDGNTGVIGGNMFAIATNATAKLTIGTGLMWAPNGTEAGWSTARPA